MKKAITLGVLVFVFGCLATAGWILQQDRPPVEPLIRLQQTTTTPTESTPVIAPAPTPPAQASKPSYNAKGGPAQTLVLGSKEKDSTYTFALELTSQGAALKQVTLSRFDNRDPDDPQPLEFLSPVQPLNQRPLYSLANQGLVLVGPKQKLSLDRLSWALVDETQDANGIGLSATFQATITQNTGDPLLRLTKVFTIEPDSYLLYCRIAVENLSAEAQDFYLQMSGPAGPGREAFRQDMRKAMAAYRNSKGEVTVTVLDNRKLKKADRLSDRELKPKQADAQFLWTAATNKYFAAIVVPQPVVDGGQVDWLRTSVAERFLTPTEEDENAATVGLTLQTRPVTLDPEARTDYDFQIYLGPKDKKRFDNTPLFDTLGFAYVIDFIVCCCPTALIRPLAFFIMGLMDTMHNVLHLNYGVAIIVLVFLMRLALHPITKKSQISMHKMSKLAPRAEEIKKKYANNKQELNKHLMELYREQGASPIMGFLPMFFQMPIWIALWSAVNGSINLRGAGFLPFWITDLSVPDHLFKFPGFELPFFGAYFNLLPLLMGVAFYLQQKLMPTQQNAAANPQMAQQQKMMMIMMPIMFPVMMYSVPSGVNLYIMTSTFAGVIEQHVIRKHIKEKEALESVGRVQVTSKIGKNKKKKPKPMIKTKG